MPPDAQPIFHRCEGPSMERQAWVDEQGSSFTKGKNIRLFPSSI